MKKKTNIPTCNIEAVDEAKVAVVKKSLPTEEEVTEIAETYKILSDPTRLKIVLALAEAELCVCDLAALINISVSGVSHQLRLLRNSRIVKYRREGKMVFYSLDDTHISNIISEVLNHIKENCND